MKLLLKEVSDIDVLGEAAVKWEYVEVLRPDVMILNTMTWSLDKPHRPNSVLPSSAYVECESA